MPRKLIAIALIGLLFLVHFGTALAAGPGDLQLSGQAVTDRSERQARLTLTADSAGAGGWHLDATLSPAASGARSGSRTTGLSGSFTLRGPGGASAAGSASGQLDQGGPAPSS
ncbi:MAG: hypothetical protein Q7R39_16710 [Dehalococcoidia bacterium]|nr:hypothetical protein [Dehalococcoidia bacterium]